MGFTFLRVLSSFCTIFLFISVLAANQASATPTFGINAGGPAYNYGSGILYKADANFSGGRTAVFTNTINGTSSPTLYQSERYGNFSYTIPVDNGGYSVMLRFAELYWTAAGRRVFDVSINGTRVVSGLDIFARVGRNAPYNLTFPVNVSNGAINIVFTTRVDNAKVSA
ncbi:MAG TPA: malectin, partial [Bdellovibrionota bacterium]|nr:malectin [Bdellovibrionota bacterium]